jgi:hypothetical protein
MVCPRNQRAGCETRDTRNGSESRANRKHDGRWGETVRERWSSEPTDGCIVAYAILLLHHPLPGVAPYSIISLCPERPPTLSHPLPEPSPSFWLRLLRYKMLSQASCISCSNSPIGTPPKSSQTRSSMQSMQHAQTSSRWTMSLLRCKPA